MTNLYVGHREMHIGSVLLHWPRSDYMVPVLSLIQFHNLRVIIQQHCCPKYKEYLLTCLLYILPNLWKQKRLRSNSDKRRPNKYGIEMPQRTSLRSLWGVLERKGFKILFLYFGKGYVYIINSFVFRI